MCQKENLAYGRETRLVAHPIRWNCTARLQGAICGLGIASFGCASSHGRVQSYPHAQERPAKHSEKGLERSKWAILGPPVLRGYNKLVPFCLL